MVANTGGGFSVVVDADGAVRAAGELDFACASELQEAIEMAIAGGAGDVIVDLSEVAFIDSSGMNVFVRCFKPLKEQGRALVLRGPAPVVRRTLELGGITTFLTVQ